MRSSTLTTTFASLVGGVLTGWFFTSPRVADSGQTRISNTTAIASTPALPGSLSSSSAPRSENEFVARLHDILSIDQRAKRERAILSVADGMSVSEIRDALDRLDEIKLRERGRVRKLLLARWGELDPEGAISYAMGRQDLGERTEFVSAVLAGWCEKDVKSAEGWIVALPTGPLKREAMEALVKALAVSDPRHALQLAQDPKNVPFQSYGISSDSGSPLVHALFDKWLDDDPKAAAEAAIALPSSVHFRDAALHVVGKRWAEKDLDAALAWANSNAPVMDNSDYQRNPLTGVLNGWLTADPDAAIEWLNESPDGEGKVGLIRSLVSQVYGHDPGLAMNLAIVIPPGSMREQAIVHSARNWLMSEPQSAAKWALQQEDDSIRRIALRSVAAEWMHNDPSGAREWINSLPSDAVRETTLQDAIGMIANGVTWETSGYMTKGYIDMMSSEAIQSAAQTIEQISDVAQRKAAYTKFAARWLSRDPQAAQAWIGSLPVAAEEKDALLKAKAPPWPPNRK